jgi:hypothetical protein
MKLILILSILFQISTANFFEIYSKMLESVIDEFLIKEKIFDFEILIYCKQKQEKWKINKILSQLRENFAVEVKSFEKKIGANEVERSTVALFCCERDLNEFNKNSMVSSFFPKSIKIFAFSIEVWKEKFWKKKN